MGRARLPWLAHRPIRPVRSADCSCDRHHASRAYSSPWTTNSFGNFVTGADGFNSMGTQPSSAPPAERSTWRRARSTAFGRSWRSQPVVTRPLARRNGQEPAAVRRRRRGGGRGGRGTPHRTPGAAARDGDRSRRRAPGKQVDVGAARLGATAVAERRPPRRRPRRANGAAPRLPELATRVPAARAGQRRLRAGLTAARGVPLPGRGTLIAVGLAARDRSRRGAGAPDRCARPRCGRPLPRTRRSAGTVGRSLSFAIRERGDAARGALGPRRRERHDPRRPGERRRR